MRHERSISWFKIEDYNRTTLREEIDHYFDHMDLYSASKSLSGNYRRNVYIKGAGANRVSIASTSLNLHFISQIQSGNRESFYDICFADINTDSWIHCLCDNECIKDISNCCEGL